MANSKRMTKAGKELAFHLKLVGHDEADLKKLEDEEKEYFKESLSKDSKRDATRPPMESKYVKRRQKLRDKLAQDEAKVDIARKVGLEEAQSFIEKQLLPEAMAISDKKDAIYDNGVERAKELRKELMDLERDLVVAKRESRSWRAVKLDLEHHWSAERVFAVVNDVEGYLSILSPALAMLLGVEEQYYTLKDKRQKQHQKEMEQVRAKEEKKNSLKKTLLEKAKDMFARKEIPPDLWDRYGNRAGPDIIYRYLLQQETKGVTSHA